MAANTQRLIAVIGAGPAGLYAADVVARAGHDVVLLNRDLKPGGLVEYGVFPTKHKFKCGLRTVFRKILRRENVHYRGLVTVGQEGVFPLDDVREMPFDAVVVAVGAQGTKALGLPGEDAEGVYHAKDLVYHFNLLPPFASGTFPVGEKIVIIGVGNVMVDIVHWLYRFKRVKEVVAVSRTVPRFRSWVDKEIKELPEAIDAEGMRAEVESLRPLLEEAGEDPDRDIEELLKYAAPSSGDGCTRWRVRWLVSPLEIALDEAGRCKGLMVQPLRPSARPDGGRPKVEPLGEPELMEADNVIFAIGDQVDPNFGLPVGSWGYMTVSDLDPEAPAADYRLVGPDRQTPLEGTFAVGWAREPSTGLVGQARKDGTAAGEHVLAYLEGRPTIDRPVADRLAELDRRIEAATGCLIDFASIERLAACEVDRALDDPLEGKFATNEEMLEAICRRE